MYTLAHGRAFKDLANALDENMFIQEDCLLYENYSKTKEKNTVNKNNMKQKVQTFNILGYVTLSQSIAV